MEVDSKTNEITAIDELLNFIDVRRTIITLDAIEAQKKIAAEIISEGGDYIFAIKDNHPKTPQLQNRASELFRQRHDRGFRDAVTALVVLRHEGRDFVRHVAGRNQVELGLRFGEDRPQCELALEGDQIREHGFLFRLVEQHVSGLVLGRDPNRGVPD